MNNQRLRRIESLLNLYDRQVRAQLPARPLKTVQDVLDLLQEQAEAIRADPWSGTIEKARALTYLAGVARRTMETGIIADRMEILETILQQRKGKR
jgi:hypothetical protein